MEVAMKTNSTQIEKVPRGIAMPVFKVSALIFFFSLLTAPLFAQQDGVSAMQLRLQDNSRFELYLNGQYMGQASAGYYLQNLNAGNHYVRILKTYGVPGGYSVSYPYYEGTINLPAYTSSSLVVQSWNSYYIEQQVAYNPFPVQPGPGGNYWPGYQLPQAMSQADFDQLKRSVENRWFDSDKLQTAQLAIKYSYLRSSQVRELIELMDFEDSRLELAKQAFDRVVDPGNYHLVFDAFWFSSSVDDLSEYIAMR